MMTKWIGAALIIAGSGAIGYSMASAHRAEVSNMRMLLGALNLISCELQYHLPPLSDLCRYVGKETAGTLKSIFMELASELDHQILPDVGACMESVLSSKPNLPEITRKCLRQLGASLGKFDLDGQLKGIESVRTICKSQLVLLEKNKDSRLRNYQTLSICAGAALAIVLI